MIVDSGVRDAPTRRPIETERPHAGDPGSLPPWKVVDRRTTQWLASVASYFLIFVITSWQQVLAK